MTDLFFTLGESSLGKEEAMLRHGATGARLTFSFGTPSEQNRRAESLKRAAERAERPCHVMADLAGAKPRLGTFGRVTSVRVKAGQRIRLVHAASQAQAGDDRLPVVNADFFHGLTAGTVIWVGDGSARLHVVKVELDGAVVEAELDGTIDQCRGVVIEGAAFHPVPMTERDWTALGTIAECPYYDSVAVSFVGTADDVSQVKQWLRDKGQSLPVIAKIETAAGVENIHAICTVADRIMVARGDLAMAIPWPELPAAVDRIVKTANDASVPWLLATQVLEGTERFVIPTRAEICDLAHWLKVRCAGVILSHETAFGPHPENSVACAARLIARYGSSADHLA